MGIGNLLPPVFRVDELRDVLHRSRPIERDHCGDICNGCGLEVFHIPAHAVTLELEHSESLCLAQHLERRLVV